MDGAGGIVVVVGAKGSRVGQGLLIDAGDVLGNALTSRNQITVGIGPDRRRATGIVDPDLVEIGLTFVALEPGVGAIRISPGAGPLVREAQHTAVALDDAVGVGVEDREVRIHVGLPGTLRVLADVEGGDPVLVGDVGIVETLVGRDLACAGSIGLAEAQVHVGVVGSTADEEIAEGSEHVDVGFTAIARLVVVDLDVVEDGGEATSATGALMEDHDDRGAGVSRRVVVGDVGPGEDLVAAMRHADIGEAGHVAEDDVASLHGGVAVGIVAMFVVEGAAGGGIDGRMQVG